MKKQQHYKAGAGESIHTACAEAVKIARLESCEVEFEFNEQRLLATPKSSPNALAESYMAECERRHAEYVASPEYKRQQEEYERKQRERENALNAALHAAPKNMTLRDPEGWKKSCEVNKDGYGGAVMTYAERWARIMEGRMAKAKENALRTSLTNVPICRTKKESPDSCMAAPSAFLRKSGSTARTCAFGIISRPN